MHLESILSGRLDDEAGIDRLSDTIREWEPSLDAYSTADNSLLFEPDGTLYVVCLSRSTLRFRHHTREVAPGDCVIMPQGCAIEADPGLDHFCIRHQGLAPYHFRERFIQVTGFELISIPSPAAPGFSSMISDDDYRYRMPHAAFTIEGGSLELAGMGPSLNLIVVISGSGSITDQGTGASVPVSAGDVLLRAAETRCRLAGTLQGIAIRLIPESVYEVLRSAAEQTKGPDWSPEFIPRPF